MGKKSGQQTVSNDPWGPAQANLKFALNEANRIYGGMHPGSMAPSMGVNPTALSAGGKSSSPSIFGVGGREMNAMQTNAMQTSQPFNPNEVSGYNLWAPAQDEMMKTISGDYLDGSNPYLDAMIARARAGVNSNFAGMSRYGSGSHIDQIMTQAEAPIRYQDYSAERARQERAIGGLPAFQQGYANAPYADLNAFTGVVNPIARQGSQTNQPLTSNPLGGALGGAALGATIAPAGATFLGSAAAGGAAAVPAMWPYLLGGALLGGFAS